MKTYVKRIVLYFILVVLTTIILYATACIANSTFNIANWSSTTKTTIAIFYFISQIAAIVVPLSLDEDDIDSLTN